MRVEAVLPVLFGAADDMLTIHMQSLQQIADELPKVVPMACIERVKDVLSKKGITCRASLTTITVQSIVGELLGFSSIDLSTVPL
jgi:hypothetical protein